MDRIDYQTQIEILIENACDELSVHEFEKLKERISELISDYE